MNKGVALAHPGQPEESAPTYVFLASGDGSFVTGCLLDVTAANYRAMDDV